jgi:hypothetical protein
MILGVRVVRLVPSLSLVSPNFVKVAGLWRFDSPMS